MLLTLEFSKNQEAVEIYCDHEGLDLLISKLETLRARGGHVHLMTPSWAGDELTEEPQGEQTQLINHLVVALKPV